jgi:hypothetical protein
MSQIHSVTHVPVHSPLSEVWLPCWRAVRDDQGGRCGQERDCYETRPLDPARSCPYFPSFFWKVPITAYFAAQSGPFALCVKSRRYLDSIAVPIRCKMEAILWMCLGVIPTGNRQ